MTSDPFSGAGAFQGFHHGTVHQSGDATAEPQDAQFEEVQADRNFGSGDTPVQSQSERQVGPAGPDEGQPDAGADDDTDPTPGDMPDYWRRTLGVLSEADMLGLFGLKQSTLYNWRRTGQGPVFVKVGKTVFYREHDISQWLFTQRVLPNDPIAAGRNVESENMDVETSRRRRNYRKADVTPNQSETATKQATPVDHPTTPVTVEEPAAPGGLRPMTQEEFEALMATATPAEDPEAEEQE